MVTLIIQNKQISWSKDIALLMARYYRKAGVPVKIIRHPTSAGNATL